MMSWLRDHPSIEFIARDLGASCGEAASKGAPQAKQIADRWHLFENASASFLDVVRFGLTRRASGEAAASRSDDWRRTCVQFER
jgi:hypothetical protein